MAFVAFENIVHANMYKVYNYISFVHMCIIRIFEYTRYAYTKNMYFCICISRYISRDLHGSNKLFKASLMASFSFLIAFSQLITSVELVFRLLTYKLGFYEFCKATEASIFYRGY